MDQTIIIDRILRELTEHPEIVTKEQFHTFANAIYADYALPRSIAGMHFIERYNTLAHSWILSYEPRIWRILRKRAVRSLSGVTVISILTKPWSCPGRCVFCPTYSWLPKSYVTNEPAVMRAELNAFDPIRQIHNRLRSLEITGHTIEKCDVRVIGGTWSAYPKQYREDYIRDIYDAHTTYSSLREAILPDDSNDQKHASFRVREGFEIMRSATLEEAKRRNETAECRVIGIAIETRPDAIDAWEIQLLRRHGITRVEIGYQTTFDKINERSKRWHGNTESIRATKLLKDAGFKVVAHMMPNLPGSTPEMDLTSLREIFKNPDYRPDELKIYPMVITKHTEVEQDWRDGKWTPYDDTMLIDLMARLQAIIPEYVRLNRMYRDIPSSEILAGSHLANLRQITDEHMRSLGLTRRDISAREIRDKGNDPRNAILDVTSYEASEGIEYFLQWIDPADRTVFSLLRLRIPSSVIPAQAGISLWSLWDDKDQIPGQVGDDNTSFSLFSELRNTAVIRELHTFGDQLRVGETSDGTGQHMGFWKQLMTESERIVRESHPKITRIAVIAGVGVRAYYAKLGYRLEGEYMIKDLR